MCPVCECGLLKRFDDYSFIYASFGYVRQLVTLKCDCCNESFLYSKDEEMINALLKEKQSGL